jgi:hypothetical protein
MDATSSQPIYVFPVRALRRWRDHNLTIEARADGGCSVTFAFEGSTCGNIAFPLRYRVELAAEADGRGLQDLWSESVPYADGHTFMCCWQEDGAAVQRSMATEKPLLGQPLDAVLTWRPSRSPAGCLCAEPSRMHKWQAVLETLHFAISNPVS